MNAGEGDSGGHVLPRSCNGLRQKCMEEDTCEVVGHVTVSVVYGGGYLAATDSVHPVRQAARARSQKSAHRSLLPV